MQRTKRFALFIFVLICLFQFVEGAGSNGALKFDGSDDRVTLGPASATSSLGVTNFTIELWFMRQGAGVAAYTGNGGIAAVPLVTKGMAQAENSNQDTNYFVGIDTKTGALAADFEEFGTVVPPGGTSGVNHPIVGTTRICDGVWYHGAVTYDSVSGQFRLYVNGNQEAAINLTPGTRPRFDSIQFPALGAAFTSTGSYTAQLNGAFHGMMDEVRIWNVARTQASIQSTMGAPLVPPQTGLVGRWALDETTGTTAVDTAGTANGTLGNSVPAVAGGVPTFVDGSSSFVTTPLPSGNNGIKFSGLLLGTSSIPAGDYISLGQATSTLGTKKFTLEAWIKRTGAGTATSTGGVSAVPLSTKGTAESDNSNVDANYFFGLTTTGKLTADFEDNVNGTNHPASGLATVAIDLNAWHHVAVTYDINPVSGAGSYQFYLDVLA